MERGAVQVYVTRSRNGRPRVSTLHHEADTRAVHAAMSDVEIPYMPVREPSDWPRERRVKYVAALRRRGLVVFMVDNRNAGKT